MHPERLRALGFTATAVMQGLALLAVACTGTPLTQLETSEPTSTARVPAGADSVDGDREAATTDTTAPAPPKLQPSRTAEAAGPFGPPDLWIGAGPPASGLQRSIGAGDIPGPLLGFGGTAPGAEYAVRDTCNLPDLLARAEAAGAAFWLNSWLADRLERCTSLHRFEVTHGTSSRNWRYFATRARAEQWIARQQNDTIHMTTLPTDTSPFGVKSSHSSFGIMFALFDAPVDEVQVLPDTVAVSGGVLRGLVRNWSRRLWAYEVTVTAGEQVFSWPMSVQPGEVAPFEITGWDGPADAEQIEFGVDAGMSWHADPSRALRSTVGSVDLTWYAGPTRTLPDGVRERYPEVTADVAPAAESRLSAWWDFVAYRAPASHLSWAQDIESLAVSDLRGYGAVVDSRGRVVDVGPASISTVLRDPDTGTARLVELQEWPHPDVDIRDGVFLRFDIYAELPYDGRNWGEPVGDLRSEVRYLGRDDGIEWGTLHGGFVIWVGAAHPQFDDSMQ